MGDKLATATADARKAGACRGGGSKAAEMTRADAEVKAAAEARAQAAADGAAVGFGGGGALEVARTRR